MTHWTGPCDLCHLGWSCEQFEQALSLVFAVDGDFYRAAPELER